MHCRSSYGFALVCLGLTFTATFAGRTGIRTEISDSLVEDFNCGFKNGEFVCPESFDKRKLPNRKENDGNFDLNGGVSFWDENEEFNNDEEELFALHEQLLELKDLDSDVDTILRRQDEQLERDQVFRRDGNEDFDRDGNKNFSSRNDELQRDKVARSLINDRAQIGRGKSSPVESPFSYYQTDRSVGWDGPHADALKYARRPFDDPATYTVVDGSSKGYKGYNLVPCDCPGRNCDRVLYVDELRHEWDARIQTMCLVKAGRESDAMRHRIEKRGSCFPYNNCYKTGAEDSAVARCPNRIGHTLLKRGLTNAEKNGLLYYHNLLRVLRAEGKPVGSIAKDRRPVANMMEMEWDAALADQAQRLANTCEFVYDCSYCSGRAYREPVGQIFVHLRSKGTDYMRFLTTILLEASELMESDVRSFTGFNATGLHGQLLWAKTSRVGCGLVQREIFRRVETLLVCNYLPSGNRVSSSVFKYGLPCSRCPLGTSCSRFSKGLCSRYFQPGSKHLEPEKSEQFFGITDEEKLLRSRILRQLSYEVRNTS